MHYSKKIKHQGFGGIAKLDCITFRPEKAKQIAEIITEQKGKLIAKGNGRFYGGQFIQPEGVIDCHRLDRFLEFNESEGIIKVESGVTLKTLQNVAFKKGWSLPFFISDEQNTIGGIIASDIKASNICLEDFVISFEIYNNKAELINCSKTENQELYYATLAGCGLTGVISTAQLKLIPSKTKNFKITRKKLESIDEITSFLQHEETDNNDLTKDNLVIKKGEEEAEVKKQNKKSDKEPSTPKASNSKLTKLSYVCSMINGQEIKSYSESIEFADEVSKKKIKTRSLALHRFFPRFFKLKIEEEKFNFRYNLGSETRAEENYLFENRVKPYGRNIIKFSCIIEHSFVEDIISFLNNKLADKKAQNIIIKMFGYKENKSLLNPQFSGCYLFFEMLYNDANKDILDSLQEYILDKNGVSSYIDFHESSFFDKNSFSANAKQSIDAFNNFLHSHNFDNTFSSIFSERLKLTSYPEDEEDELDIDNLDVDEAGSKTSSSKSTNNKKQEASLDG